MLLQAAAVFITAKEPCILPMVPYGAGNTIRCKLKVSHQVAAPTVARVEFDGYDFPMKSVVYVCCIVVALVGIWFEHRSSTSFLRFYFCQILGPVWFNEYYFSAFASDLWTRFEEPVRQIYIILWQGTFPIRSPRWSWDPGCQVFLKWSLKPLYMCTLTI